MRRYYKILPYTILLFIGSSILKAQWESPISISDSLSNNTNPTLYLYAKPSNEILMVWEKSFDSTSTSIYYRNLSPISSQIALLDQENVHFKNPHILEGTLELNSQFYLFYETNQNGINEIYYLKYLNSGEFSEPIPLFTQTINIEQMHTSDRIITWIQNGNVVFSERKYSNGIGYFTEPKVMDSDSCRQPISINDIISWIKTFNDSSQIRYSQYSYANYEWETPRIISSEGFCSDITLSNDEMGSNYITWESYDEISNVFIADLLDAQVQKIDLFSQINKFDPAIYTVPKITKRSFLNLFPNLIAFVLDTLGTEIYANVDENFENFLNITNNSFVDRNPCFFPTHENSVLLLWESNVNDHWQLFMSKSYYTLGSVNQNEIMPQNINLYNNYPNPFNNKTQIKYSVRIPSEIRLSIYNTIGKEIKILSKGVKLQGDYIVKWDGTDKNDDKVTTGVYFVILKSDRYRLCNKLLLLK